VIAIGSDRPRSESSPASERQVTVVMREPIVVFDTNCVLCSGMVAFILAHERNRALRFVGAWSDEGLALAARHHFSKSDLDQTFLVLSGDAALSRSDAGVEILSQLRAPWRWLAVVRIIPRPVATLFTASSRDVGTVGLGGARTASSCRRVRATGSSASVDKVADQLNRADPAGSPFAP